MRSSGSSFALTGAAALLVLAPGAAISPAAGGAEEVAVLPMAANAEIEDLGRQFGRRYASAATRLDAILDFIFSDEDGLTFGYQRLPSRTAAEALDHRSGNCISLVNLFVALARAATLSAGFVEVLDYEVFYREEQSVVRSTHMIGGVEIDGRLVTVDFFPGRPKTYRRTRPISDQRAAAHFYNSVAVAAMLEGDLEAAEAGYRRALEIDPDHAETWSNRALLRLRTGAVEEAVEFLERALEVDPGMVSAMENLAPVYRRQGRLRLARQVEERALKQRTQNPFFLLQKAVDRIRARELEEAEKLLRRARRLDDSIPEVHLALGQVDLLQHRETKAEAHFERARARSAEYSRSFQGRIQTKIDRLLGG